MDTVEIIAYIACAILAVLTLFQLALVLGAPLGKYAWGGAHTILPAKLRVGSFISVVLYGAFAAVILSRAGAADIGNKSLMDIGIWILTGYFFIGVLMNGISRSKPERAVMTPVALALAICCLSIAID